MSETTVQMSPVSVHEESILSFCPEKERWWRLLLDSLMTIQATQQQPIGENMDPEMQQCREKS